MHSMADVHLVGLFTKAPAIICPHHHEEALLMRKEPVSL